MPGRWLFLTRITGCYRPDADGQTLRMWTFECLTFGAAGAEGGGTPKHSFGVPLSTDLSNRLFTRYSDHFKFIELAFFRPQATKLGKRLICEVAVECEGNFIF